MANYELDCIKTLNIQFEKAIRLLVQYLPTSTVDTRKPIIPHVIRVGVYLYEHGYESDIVLAGILHDALEFSQITERMIQENFGNTIAQLVLACTKNDTIQNQEAKTEELIKRCIQNGQNALIVKAADIIDSYKYYTATDNEEQILYCLKNTTAIFKYIPDQYTDRIFKELKDWQTTVKSPEQATDLL